MSALYLEALGGIAASFSVLMAGGWVVQQRTGNSGWVDGIWPFPFGLVGAGSALWPVEVPRPTPGKGCSRDRQLRISPLFGRRLHDSGPDGSR